MPFADPVDFESYQSGFERRWAHLTRPHVRALAWLLDDPDLLDPAAPQWQGRVAKLGPMSQDTADWLAALEADPAPLDAALGARHYSRLGLYAEKLMAFYFAERGNLVALADELRAGPDLPDVPLIALTTEGIDPTQQALTSERTRQGVAERTRHEIAEGRKKMVAALVSAMSYGQRRVVSGIGHNQLCFQRPDVVVDAVRDVLDRVVRA